MKQHLLILFCSLVCGTGFAQYQKRIDSLYTALAVAQSDSARYFLLENLHREYLEYKNDSALYYAEKRASIAETNNWNLALAYALDDKGYVQMLSGRFTESFRTLKKGFDLAENPANEARDCFPDSWGANAHIIRLKLLANMHHDFGHLMGQINNADRQLFHYREAEKLANEIGDEEMKAYLNMNLGRIYCQTYNELDTALALEQKARSTFEQLGALKYLGNVFVNLGRIHQKKNEKTFRSNIGIYVVVQPKGH